MSLGAHRRQLALKGEQPLNLPDNSLLDGLFTSGLRFVSNWSGLKGGGRVATARYEMLHITEESHKLGPPLSEPGVREFLVPTQLHELFCWVHHLKPLDLIGKPWANYHLEMQLLQVIICPKLNIKAWRLRFLLQDALKLVRRDRTVLASSGLHNQTQVSISHQPNYTDMGNGVTMIWLNISLVQAIKIYVIFMFKIFVCDLFLVISYLSCSKNYVIIFCIVPC